MASNRPVVPRCTPVLVARSRYENYTNKTAMNNLSAIGVLVVNDIGIHALALGLNNWLTV